MGIKVNRQTDMDKLFDQFATIPEGKLRPEDIDAKKAEKEAARKAAYAKLDKQMKNKD
ncbi:SPJ_0845 family protein [Lacticaseibacillus zhaodongensis]|uniref:SPJ_0845 family protein n=1 Tax=Lacticaseibacillus zhaodongensis TaxID=2668065 RepID=UPI0018AF5A71|nr:SPJ_0845 family protein [Lacticaseibacillus zhaodongensis]